MDGSSILPFATTETRQSGEFFSFIDGLISAGWRTGVRSSPSQQTGPPSGGLFFMFSVYILYSPTFKKIYVGYTSDLTKRLKSHNELAVKGWTIKFRPWQIIHTENFDTKASAMRREEQLKTAQGRKWIWQLLNKS